jgi:hypothetical protein
MDFPIPATVTDAKPELVYDPYATIVYNAGDNYYSDIVPTEVTADKVTTVFRNQKQLATLRDRHESNVEKVREYLIENYDELDEHAKKIADLLGIELSNEIEVEMSVTIKATIVVPIGTSVYDLSTYDFDVELSCNESDYEIQDYDADVDDIRER